MEEDRVKFGVRKFNNARKQMKKVIGLASGTGTIW